MHICWLVVTIELIFGENILKGDGLSHVLDSTFDQINDISYLDFSDLSMIEKATSILTQNITQQQINVTLALSKLSNNSSQTEISNDDKNKILGFYDILQERMSILSSLSERTYDFYSEQMAENDYFISKTEEMIMIINDMDIHDDVDEVIDIIIEFKKSVNQTKKALFVLILAYKEFTTNTEAIMNEQRIQIPKAFLDKYKKDGFSTKQNVMLWAMFFAVFVSSPTPLWPWVLETKAELSVQYERSNLELIQTYENIDDNIQKSFSTLEQCINSMGQAQKTLKDIDKRLGIHLKDIKRIRRTAHELNAEFTNKNAKKLLRKLRILKNSFERRQNDFFKQKKAELEN